MAKGDKYVPFNPASEKAFRLSRNRIENFLNCARCFWLEMRYGIKQPERHAAFALYNVNDRLMKLEFDQYRTLGHPHPEMARQNINGVPFLHPEPKVFERWRRNRDGMETFHKPTGMLVTGAVDDIWLMGGTHLSNADYKSGAGDVHELQKASYWGSYTRQAEIYNWILRQMGLQWLISEFAYFVYARAIDEREDFGNKMLFETHIIKHECDSSWVESVILRVKECLMSDEVPEQAPNCKYCNYRKAVFEVSRLLGNPPATNSK